ncbi:hypothetical protein [Blastochloris viridis]|uniref:Uncharacterized protein n=1 Tax=Blastochloris viridis TaxID=1079 RepID=A0A0H5BI74_BLAVI|nr:hypothetical protein [Blastochloris viridis]ALK09981.1 hypothetical protein BVIR_2213 [Blastochloris viridis]BAS00102.1 hypothetical protein BV133_2508 [Blastochloris viridis]CUU42644.1 hypothetical protein BVIRIDIS_16580 [Blastochloris viridis]
MRFRLAALVLAAATLPVQAKDPPKAPAKPAQALETVSYIPLYGDLLGALSADAVLKEIRQGGKLVAAELDVCHAINPRTERKDRFVIALKPDGARLTGSGESTEQKVPISVQLVRKATGKTLAFEGTITRGGTIDKVDIADLTEQTEEQFLEGQPTDIAIEAEPKAFGEVSPIGLAVRVKRDALPGLLQTLRGENVRVTFRTLIEPCHALRAGQQVVQFEVASDRAANLVDKMRTLPGVTDAGWTAAGANDWTVRFPAASWRDAKGLDRDRLAGRIGEIAAGVLGATSRDVAWDPVTGELKLTLKRTSEIAPSLALTDIIDLQMLIAPETTGATSEHAILWLESAALTTADENSGPRLALAGSDDSEGEGGAVQIDTDALLNAFATAFGGQRWDSEAAGWK